MVLAAKGTHRRLGLGCADMCLRGDQAARKLTPQIEANGMRARWPGIELSGNLRDWQTAAPRIELIFAVKLCQEMSSRSQRN